MTDSDRKQLAKRLEECLVAAYGEWLCGVLLYGSFARGEENADSDIDVLVLLDHLSAYGREVRCGLDALYPLSVSLARRISIKPVLKDDYEKQAYPLFRNVRREGIAA